MYLANPRKVNVDPLENGGNESVGKNPPPVPYFRAPIGQSIASFPKEFYADGVPEKIVKF
jgi:hypothetical protein